MNRNLKNHVIIAITPMLILVAFAILKFIFHEHIPDFVFLILGIATLLSPLLYSLADKKISKDKKTRRFSHIFYYVVTFINVTAIFFVYREFFLPFLLTTLPLTAFLTYLEYKQNVE